MMSNSAPFDAQVFNGGTTTGQPGDLITGEYAIQALAAGGIRLKAAQTALLPSQITAVSRAICKRCNRQFVRATYDGLYTIDQPGATLLLRQFPVNSIERVATNPTPVLTIGNTATTVNQRASVQLATTAVIDVPDLPPTVTGLMLTRLASGVKSIDLIPFESNLTLGSVATAVNALSGGWTASVPRGYELYASADLRAVQGAMPALGGNAASLALHIDDLPFVLVQPTVGELAFADAGVDPFTSLRWGPTFEANDSDLVINGVRGGVRVIYDAGWDVVPEDIQLAAAETLIDWFNGLKVDNRIESERAGEWSYKLRDPNQFTGQFPASALGKIAPYINRRA